MRQNRAADPNIERIRKALALFNLPPLVSYNDIRKRYHELSLRHHPDINQKKSKMDQINEAYAILKEYIFNYRFTFSDEEIRKQHPQSEHTHKFRF